MYKKSCSLSEFLGMLPTKEVSLDLKDWTFFNLPSEDLTQLKNSNDCNVFVANLAKHLPLGQPLDFTQDDRETCWFLLVLEISYSG